MYKLIKKIDTPFYKHRPGEFGTADHWALVLGIDRKEFKKDSKEEF